MGTRARYRARVPRGRCHLDPHLTDGCEAVLDVRSTALEDLENVQHTYLRRALHISSRSQLAPLFFETGIWPLLYRRLQLALRYLYYLLAARPTLAYAALRESWRLANADNPSPSWRSDLCLAATRPPASLHIPLRSWPTPGSVTALLAEIPRLVAGDLYQSLMASQRLPVLQTRQRYDLARTGCKPASLCAPCEYLRLPRHRQRAAITPLLFSEHPLPVEQYRRGPARRFRNMGICRWCCHDRAVEDEIHALLECNSAGLANVRHRFLAEVFNTVPALQKAHFRLTGAQLLDMLLRGKTTLPLLATYVADVFDLCNCEAGQLVFFADEDAVRGTRAVPDEV
ncbi:hypothetical protein C8Q77DRAFT_1068312 [Trametes polyzona]|nr:hypothetical protein C8Q77DRAFT_1068312 [Trametes polyzona]